MSGSLKPQNIPLVKYTEQSILGVRKLRSAEEMQLVHDHVAPEGSDLLDSELDPELSPGKDLIHCCE